jgi:calcineurin-like phosphoesterase family protein
MDQKMIQQWQSQINHDDDVFLLGDVFFSNTEQSVKTISRLPGKKHLIYGNHDQVIRGSKELQSHFVSIQEYKELKFNGQELILFHYPIQEWNKIHHGAIHCYGHIHQRRSNVGGRAINVCVDSPDLADVNVPYRLYPIEEVVSFGLKKEIRYHHEKINL